MDKCGPKCVMISIIEIGVQFKAKCFVCDLLGPIAPSIELAIRRLQLEHAAKWGRQTIYRLCDR